MYDLILLFIFLVIGFIILNKKVLREDFKVSQNSKVSNTQLEYELNDNEKNNLQKENYLREDFKVSENSKVSDTQVEYELNENPFITSDHIKQLSILTDRINLNKLSEPLRNSNLQLRTEPINPQVLVGPFNLSTIDPDMNRRVNDLT